MPCVQRRGLAALCVLGSRRADGEERDRGYIPEQRIPARQRPPGKDLMNYSELIRMACSELEFSEFKGSIWNLQPGSSFQF